MSASLGVPLDDWQESVFEAAMGERADGRWAARLVGVSTPRQNGKSQLIVARALAGVLLLDEQMIICSAHQTDTAREVFQRLLDIIESNPSLGRRVESVMKAINREHIRFKGGQTIKFKARSAPGGRGFACDCLLLDEAQILGAPAWASILPTMSARDNPQAWLLGTPPTPQDEGEVFARVRERGLTGRESRLAYLEWSADAGDDLDDVETWWKANPAFGYRISQEAIESERASMTDAQFAMERLGMWNSTEVSRVIDADSWAVVADPTSMSTTRLTLAADVSPDRRRAAVGLAGQRPDGRWHVELDEHRNGADWVPKWIEARAARNQLHAVVLDEMSGLVERRHGRAYLVGTDVVVTTAAAEGRDMGVACGRLFDGVMSGTVVHTDQPQVNVALAGAGKRPVAGGAWAWNRRTADSDITPLVAVTLALWGAQNSTVKRPTRSTVRRKVVVRA